MRNIHREFPGEFSILASVMKWGGPSGLPPPFEAALLKARDWEEPGGSPAAATNG